MYVIATQTATGEGGKAVAAAAEVAVSAAAADEDGAAPAAEDDLAQDAEKMEIDSWESVSQQPSW